jgi:hypothetical protein
MTTLKALIERHPAPSYFALAVVISWAGASYWPPRCGASLQRSPRPTAGSSHDNRFGRRRLRG